MELVALSTLDERADQHMVSMRDGVRLATDLYLPEPSDGPKPTVLIRTPYDKGADFTFLPRLARLFNEHGYAFIAQDVRGKARSEGGLEPFRHEVADGYDTLEWLVQQPWSNGMVGMFGDSYLGFTSLTAAVSGHPALRAIVPRMMGTRRVFDDGPLSLLAVEWAGLYWASNQHVSYEIDWSIRPFTQVIPESAGRPVPAVDQLVAVHQSGADAARQYMYGTRHPISAIKIPTLHWTGFWDVLATPTIEDYLQLQERRPQHDHHLRVEAIDHEFYPLGYDGAPPALGEPIPDAVLDELLPRYTNAALRFFDRHLRGKELTIPRVEYELGGVGLQVGESWPPNTAVHHLRFGDVAGAAGEGGTLEANGSHAGSTSWQHNPDDPVPNLVRNQWSILAEWPDERPIEARDDVLTFTSPPFDEPLRLGGPVRVRLHLRWEGPGTQLIVKLMDVDEQGASRRLLLGARQIAEPASAATLDVELGHIGYLVEAGHRLRVQIASSCFPLYAPHPGTGNDPWTATETAKRRQTLVVDEDSGWIELPALSRT